VTGVFPIIQAAILCRVRYIRLELSTETAAAPSAEDDDRRFLKAILRSRNMHLCNSQLNVHGGNDAGRRQTPRDSFSTNTARWGKIAVSSICLVAVSMLSVQAQVTQSRPGQPKQSRGSKGTKTLVEFVLLTERSSFSTQAAAQKWGRLFSRLGVSMKTQTATFGDKTEIKERKLGRYRVVKVLAKLERNGRLRISSKISFALSDAPKVKKWIEELTIYGAQGSPDGKPAFGLNPTQFGSIYAMLSLPIETELQGLKLDEALAKMGLPGSYPLRMTATSVETLNKRRQLAVIRTSYKGLTKGVVLAAMLNEFSLGFRPLRSPTGAVELVVEPLAAGHDHWPVGWPPKQTNLKTAPGLYKRVPVDIKDVPLTDVLKAVAARSGVRVLIDYHELQVEGIDPTTKTVSYLATERKSWSLLLKGVTTPLKLARELRIDEQEQPFVWITSLRSSLKRR
jgi:hypothetical protein